MIKINWDQFKELLDTNQIRARFVTTSTGYEVHGADQGLVYNCTLITGESDCTEFENDYKTAIQAIPSASVSTKFEMDSIVLKLAKIQGQADANGDLTLELKVAGSIANIERYVQGGYAYTDNYQWNDALLEVDVIDKDNVTGLGANTILKTYHDTDVPTENQGWFFEKHHGAEGIVEIEPIGWYGQFNGELYLRLVFKVAANAKVKCLIYWGKVE